MRLEADDGDARIPIVALTAHAIQGTEQQCREAGMDEYLTKPLDRGRLTDVLDRYLGGGPEDPAAAVVFAVAPQSAQVAEPVDWTALLELLDGDETLARELAEVFVGSVESLLAGITEAVDCRDWDTVGASAHALKGAGGNIRAVGVAHAAARLEAAARAGEGERLESLAAELKRHLGAAVRFLRGKAA